MADPDDLSRTATLPATPESTRDAETARGLPEKIGKYRIERELGAGGMGVVYVAFDPDLERRIALKVLRTATSSEAAQRLQREARAMARLKHGNVVTVHEVATAAGRDYVAMELVEGESLAEWLKTKRTQPEILDAFVQAGRGLAAAHAAGIVHRDFKPHNVLRDRAGRVLVTDFGLAREAHGEASDPLAVTMPLAADASTTGSSKSSSLAGLTVTGALLGTPAYMAPEQWTGAAVTPATDQFAYCVALWEAVTGTRPFTGPTVDLLRAQILDGSAELDASVVPRELRAPLMRGLEADPKKRWASMDALLAAITPPVKPTRWIALALIGATAAVVITGAVLSLAGRDETPTTASVLPCQAPAVALDAAWSANKKQALVDHKRTLAVMQLDVDAKAWSAARDKACALAPDVRAQALACLDGVMGRFDAAVAAVTASTADRQLDAGAVLVDPTVCTTGHPPHITIPSPEMRLALAVEMEKASRVEDTSSIAPRAVLTDPCAATYQHAQRADELENAAARKPETELMEQALERCTDDRARADGALALLDLELRNEFVAASVRKKLRQAEIAVEPVMQSDLGADLAYARAMLASRVEDIPQGLAAAEAATRGYAARSRVYDELEIGLIGVSLHQVRATPDDLVAVKHDLSAMRVRANDVLGPDSRSVRQLDQVAAYWSFMETDVAGSHAKLLALQKPEPIEHPVSASGKVVDENGTPVAGATVAAGHFVGDDIGIVLPDPQGAPFIRTTTTAADGTFSLPQVAPTGHVVAQQGDRRSTGATVGDKLTIQLLPTSRIEGHVDLQGMAPQRALVMFVRDTTVGYGTVAPVQADGSFHIDGVPRGKQKAAVVIRGILHQAISQTVIDVNRPVVTGVQLTVPSSRAVYVVLRSQVAQPLANAQVLVLTNPVTATHLDELKKRDDISSTNIALPTQGDAVPAAVKAVARDGDLYVSITGAPPGSSACAIPLPSDINDPKLTDAVRAQAAKIPLACKTLPTDGSVIVDEVPPWPRLD